MRINCFPDHQNQREKKADNVCIDQKKTARERARRGFTLAEMLITVAIIGILAAFGFVAVIRYQKSLKQTELDDTAREIFVAAQNHMTVSRASGNWDTYVAEAEKQSESNSVADKLGAPMGAIVDNEKGPSDYDESLGAWNSAWADGALDKDEEHDFRYVTVSADGNNDPRILSMILPDDAIDETLRGNGNILIEYDAETATVYGVWYCKPADLKKAGNVNSTGASPKSITSIANTDAYNNNNRTSRSSRMKSNPMVGYYGGASSAEKEGKSEESSISAIIENDDRLMLQVAVSEESSGSETKQRSYTVKATVTGQTSGNSKEIILGTSKENPVSAKNSLKGVIDQGSVNNKSRLYFYTLDSVTDGAEGHFAYQFCSSNSVTDKPLIPGENLTITVRLVYDDGTDNKDDNKNDKSGTGKKETLMADSAGNSVILSCNSLFANGSNSGNTHTARIAYGRHLQNLSTVVSGVNSNENSGASVPGSASNSSALITNAKMLKDLDWSSMTIRFLNPGAIPRFSNGTSAGSKAGTEAYAVSSYKSGWNTTSASTSAPASTSALTAAGNFYSISDSALTTFNGNGFEISNLQIGAASDKSDAGSGTGASSSGVNASAGKNGSKTSTYVGLFGYIDDGAIDNSTMTIQRLMLKNPTAEKAAYAGFVVGKTSRETKILNITVTGDTALSLTATQAAGGILGEADNTGTSILYSKVLSGKTVKITANADKNSNSANSNSGSNSNNTSNAGGILGIQIGSKTGTEGTGTGLSIKNCTVSISGKESSSSAKGGNTSNGDPYIQINGGYSAGGILGYCSASEPGSNSGASGNNSGYSEAVTIQNCSVFGAGNRDLVSAENAAAGLAAYISTSGKVDVKNSAASVYVADSDAQANAASDGFGGLIGYLNTTGSNSIISKCYVGGRTAEGTYKENTIDNSTQGRYNIRGNGYVGGFIGQVTGSNSLKVENCFTTASAYSGTRASTNNGNGEETSAKAGSFIANSSNTALSVTSCYATGLTNGTVFVGESVSNSTSNTRDNYYLAGVNKAALIGAGVKGAKVGDAGTPFADQISKVTTNKYDTKLKGDYPYQVVSGQSVYYGDWVVPKNTQSFDRDFGILYYEIVQHGTGNGAENKKSAYYHGFVGNAVAGGNVSNESYKEISTTKTLDATQSPGYLNDHGLLKAENGEQYVTEDGYILLISDEYLEDQVEAYISWKTQTIKNWIANNWFIQYDDILPSLGIVGYHAYYINPKAGGSSTEGLKNYFEHNNDPFTFVFYKKSENNETNFKDQIGFRLNPYFADYLTTNSDSGNDYHIRSANQLNLLFDYLDGGNYIGGTDGWPKSNVVTQTMDISYDNSKINFTYLGKEVSYSSPSLGSLVATYTGGKTSSGRYYKLDHLSNSLVNNITNAPGKLKKLVITNMAADSLVETNNGEMSQLYVSDSKFTKAALVSEYNSATISDCLLQDVSIGGDGVVTKNHGVISNVRVKNATITGNGIVTENSNGWNGLTATIDNCTFVNAKIEKNGIAQTNYSIISNINIKESKIGEDGLVDTNDSNGKILTSNISDSIISDNGVAQTNSGTIGAKDGDISKGVDLQSVIIQGNGFINENNGTISNSGITNAQIAKNGVAQINSGTIGNEYNNAIRGVDLQFVTIGSNGFVYDNSNSISNSKVINAQIGENGFANINSKVIKNCQLYSDAQSYADYLKTYKNDKQYFKPESSEADETDTNSKGYGLLVCGLRNTTGATSDGKSYIENEKTAGFVNDNQYGDNGCKIISCSYSGKVYGSSIAAGFFLNNSGEIESSYANAIVTATDTVAGFGYSNIDGAVNYCHSIGMLLNAENGAGFIYSFQTGKNAWKANLKYDYSAIWQSTTEKYYFFNSGFNVENWVLKDRGRINSCAYLTSIYCDKARLQENQSNNLISSGIVRGYSYKELQKINNDYGDKANEASTKPYYQYTSTHDKVYPFAMPSGMIAYGDWSWNNAIYSIEFNGNGGKPTIDGKEISSIDDIDYVVDVILPECTPPNGRNWTFMGWQDQSGKIYSVGDKVSGLATSGTVTLTAQWKINNVTDFNYSESVVQTYTAPDDGWYKLEVWGADGGNATFDTKNNAQGGKGGYTVNYVYLTKGQQIDVYVGGRGQDATSSKLAYEKSDKENDKSYILQGGWNGGGKSYSHSLKNGSYVSYWLFGSGGGASHMSLHLDTSDNALKTLADYSGQQESILLVAGGGGGAGLYANVFSKMVDVYPAANIGGNGGGNTESDGHGESDNTSDDSKTFGHGGTKELGGIVPDHPSKSGAFGLGGSPIAENDSDKYDPGAGGGGGWYGGGSSYVRTEHVAPSAGGGSSYFKTSEITSSIKDGTTMKGETIVGGNDSIPSFESPVNGNGNGHGRITYLPSYSLNITENNTVVSPDKNNAVTISKNHEIQISLRNAQNQYVNDAAWMVKDRNGNDITALTGTGNVRSFSSSSDGTYVITATGPEGVVSASVTIIVREDDDSNAITGNAAANAASGNNSGQTANPNAAESTAGSTDSTTDGGTSEDSQNESDSSSDLTGSVDESLKKVDEDRSDESIVSSSSP